MKQLNILFYLLLLSSTGFAQITSPDNRIVVLGEAKIDVPANRVQFSITLKVTDEVSLENAYDKNAVMQKSLMKIFNQLKIRDENIKFSLLSVRKQQDYQSKQWIFYCDQNVNFTIDSVKFTPKVQELLIKEGFVNFNSQFSLKDYDQHRKEILEKAVMVAKEKAQTLALVSDRKIKRIVKIMDTEETDPMLSNYKVNVYNYSSGKSVANSSSAPMIDKNLIDIPQTITVSVTMKVVFELE